MSDAKKPVGWENNSMFGSPQPEGAGKGKPFQKIEVTDLQENTTVSYNSMSEAARALNIPSYNLIYNYIKNNQQKPYKGRYTFKKDQFLFSISKCI